MKLKPAPGLLVRDPATKLALPPEGMEIKNLSTYWHRRIKTGDVLVESEQEPELLDEPAPHGDEAAASSPVKKSKKKEETV